MNKLLMMTNDIRNRAEKGAVSIEYLAIALVVVVVLAIAIAAVQGAEGALVEQFQTAVENIFGGGA